MGKIHFQPIGVEIENKRQSFALNNMRFHVTRHAKPIQTATLSETPNNFINTLNLQCVVLSYNCQIHIHVHVRENMKTLELREGDVMLLPV